MGYDTVIFDLDGTLLDTLDDLMDSCNYALSTTGAPPGPGRKSAALWATGFET